MEKKTLSACFAALLALAVVLPAAAKGDHSFTFDKTLDPFTATTNDANKSYEFSLLTDNSSPFVCFGCPVNKLAGLKLVPSSTESGVWMVTDIHEYLEPYPSQNQIHVRFEAADVESCATCIPMIYTGATPPTKASDFSIIGTGKLTKTLQTLPDYYATAKSIADKPFYLAIGWRVKGDMLNVKGLVGIDNIELMVAPAP